MHFFILLTDPSQMRWQLTFVLRDSVTDFANVTCWGSESFIKDIAKSFRIGDAGLYAY